MIASYARRLLMLAAVIVSLLILAGPAFAQEPVPAPDLDLTSLASQLVALAGYGALVAALVNALKYFGVVKDGQAPAYTGALNLVGLIALFALKVFAPAMDVGQLDGTAGQVAQLLTVAFGLFVQLGGSKLGHLALKGAPLFGTSFSATPKA